MVTENVLAWLRIESPDELERLEPITQSPYVMGRTPDNQLQLAERLVSRRHAQLLFEGEYIRLIDLGSANGTFVGELKLPANEPYTLDYGETFQIGPYTLHLEAISASSLPQPTEGEDGALLVELPDRTQDDVIGPPAPPLPSQNGALLPQDSFGLSPECSRYLNYLPPIYSEHPFLGHFLLAFEMVLTPIEQIVDNFDLYLDPRVAPAFFLAELAAWLGPVVDDTWSMEKRRLLLTEAVSLYRQRGTRRGLSRYLEIYSGSTPQIFEPDDQPYRFNVVLYLPPGQQVNQATLERIIEANRPAHTTYTLHLFTLRPADGPFELADSRREQVDG